MSFIPKTKKFNGKVYTQTGSVYSKAKAKIEAAQYKRDGYFVRVVTIYEDRQPSYLLYVRQK